jgi:hypothetical protein
LEKNKENMEVDSLVDDDFVNDLEAFGGFQGMFAPSPTHMNGDAPPPLFELYLPYPVADFSVLPPLPEDDWAFINDASSPAVSLSEQENDSVEKDDFDNDIGALGVEEEMFAPAPTHLNGEVLSSLETSFLYTVADSAPPSLPEDEDAPIDDTTFSNTPTPTPSVKSNEMLPHSELSLPPLPEGDDDDLADHNASTNDASSSSSAVPPPTTPISDKTLPSTHEPPLLHPTSDSSTLPSPPEEEHDGASVDAPTNEDAFSDDGLLHLPEHLRSGLASASYRRSFLGLHPPTEAASPSPIEALPFGQEWKQVCLDNPGPFVFPSPSSSLSAVLHAAQQQQPLVLSQPAVASPPPSSFLVALVAEEEQQLVAHQPAPFPFPSSSNIAVQGQQLALHQLTAASTLIIPTPSSPLVVPAAAPAIPDSPGKDRPRPKDPNWARSARQAKWDKHLARQQRLRAKEHAQLRGYMMEVCAPDAQ